MVANPQGREYQGRINLAHRSDVAAFSEHEREQISQRTRGALDLVLDLTTGRRSGLTIPESFLLRADEVIE